MVLDLVVCSFSLMSSILLYVASLVAQTVKNLPAVCSIPGLERSSGEGNGYPLQYSSLENSMDCVVHGVTKGQI